MTKKKHILKNLLPTPPFFLSLILLPISLPSSLPRTAGGWGIGVVVSSSHVVSAAPSSSRGRLLILFPCSSMWSLPWETALQKIIQHEPFPQAAVLHKLLQHRSFPQGTVLQEQAAPAWRSAPLWASMGCRGTARLIVVCSTGCRGIFVLAPGAPPLSSSSLTLVSAELLRSRIFTLSGCYSTSVSPLFLTMLSQRRYQCC